MRVSAGRTAEEMMTVATRPSAETKTLCWQLERYANHCAGNLNAMQTVNINKQTGCAAWQRKEEKKSLTVLDFEMLHQLMQGWAVANVLK